MGKNNPKFLLRYTEILWVKGCLSSEKRSLHSSWRPIIPFFFPSPLSFSQNPPLNTADMPPTFVCLQLSKCKDIRKNKINCSQQITKQHKMVSFDY